MGAWRRIFAGKGTSYDYFLVSITTGLTGVIMAWGMLALLRALNVSKSVGWVFFIPAILCAIVMIFTGIKSIRLTEKES